MIEPHRANQSGPEPSRNEPSAWQVIVGSKLLMIGLLFFVTGALGLPLLWVSPAFSRRGKWWLSIVVTLYTIALIALTVGIVWWAYVQITSALSP